MGLNCVVSAVRAQGGLHGSVPPVPGPHGGQQAGARLPSAHPLQSPHLPRRCHRIQAPAEQRGWWLPWLELVGGGGGGGVHYVAGGMCCLAAVFSNGLLGEWGSSVVRVPDYDQMVAGSNPCRSSGSIFFSRVTFLCWLISVSVPPTCVTAVACKRPRWFCQKCRWQVTAKHACTLRMWLCMKRHSAWLAAVSCGTSHASAVSTPVLWLFKNVL